MVEAQMKVPNGRRIMMMTTGMNPHRECIHFPSVNRQHWITIAGMTTSDYCKGWDFLTIQWSKTVEKQKTMWVHVYKRNSCWLFRNEGLAKRLRDGHHDQFFCGQLYILHKFMTCLHIVQRTQMATISFTWFISAFQTQSSQLMENFDVCGLDENAAKMHDELWFLCAKFEKELGVRLSLIVKMKQMPLWSKHWIHHQRPQGVVDNFWRNLWKLIESNDDRSEETQCMMLTCRKWFDEEDEASGSPVEFLTSSNAIKRSQEIQTPHGFKASLN